MNENTRVPFPVKNVHVNMSHNLLELLKIDVELVLFHNQGLPHEPRGSSVPIFLKVQLPSCAKWFPLISTCWGLKGEGLLKNNLDLKKDGQGKSAIPFLSFPFTALGSIVVMVNL